MLAILIGPFVFNSVCDHLQWISRNTLVFVNRLFFVLISGRETWFPFSDLQMQRRIYLIYLGLSHREIACELTYLMENNSRKKPLSLLVF